MIAGWVGRTMTVSPDIEDLRSRARAAAEAGRWDEAADCFGQLLRRAPDDAEALNVLGASAMARGRLGEARTLLERALSVAPGDGSVRKNLGALLLQAGEVDGAIDVLGRAVADDPDFFVARLYLGLARERGGRPAAAVGDYMAALSTASARGLWLDPETTQPGLVPLVAHARRAVRTHRMQIIERVMAPLRARHGAAALARASRCLANYLGDDASRPASALQRPTFLYFPGLPETPFFDRGLFPWYEALEDAWGDIRAEMLDAIQADPLLVPFLGEPPPGMASGYLAAAGGGKARWDGFFFHRHGQRHEANCARCPATDAALREVPLVHVRGHGPETLFSVLGPGSHILPHTGVTNTRTVTHLPLVIPRDCAIRVASEVHAWRPGRSVSFDDTFEHEAWNRSDQVRVILLFDVWNPHLDPVEQEAIGEFVAALGDTGTIPA